MLRVLERGGSTSLKIDKKLLLELLNVIEAMITKSRSDPRNVYTSDFINDLEEKRDLIKVLIDDCTAGDDALKRLKEIKEHFDLFGE